MLGTAPPGGAPVPPLAASAVEPRRKWRGCGRRGRLRGSEEAAPPALPAPGSRGFAGPAESRSRAERPPRAAEGTPRAEPSGRSGPRFGARGRRSAVGPRPRAGGGGPSRGGPLGRGAGLLRETPGPEKDAAVVAADVGRAPAGGRSPEGGSGGGTPAGPCRSFPSPQGQVPSAPRFGGPPPPPPDFPRRRQTLRGAGRGEGPASRAAV